MAKQNWFPKQESARRTLLNNLADKLPGAYATKYGITADELTTLYSGAFGVLYAPFDEDYGYVTLEAFLAGKPVITASDSGGPLEFVVDRTNGLIRPPDATSIAAAINELAADRDRAAQLGRAGRDTAQAITWDGVIDRLLA